MSTCISVELVHPANGWELLNTGTSETLPMGINIGYY
ncbi:hypothetical protein SLEP1_g37171 [Rubroshorea leprosula]|uniref:Uncharacterized protein n=1 Tax=Rubroshorea leprosula TaxID=152421 RepID=A0AAV5KUB8_9ROSI|nr:hypothetical protein SLEP1_g37171 [Rubroshorea leprosula]